MSLNVNCISLTHLKTIEILEYTLERQHKRSNTGTRKRMFVFLLCLFKSQSSLYGKRSKVVVDEKKPHKKKRPTSSSSRRSSSQNDRSSTKLCFRVWTFHHLTRTRWTRFEDMKRFVVRVTKMQRRRLQFHPRPHLNRETRHRIR